jgi:iron complex outermembrane recepter protein
LRFLLSVLIVMLSVTMVIGGTITGSVTSKDTGQPLAGANVYLQGTTMGAATDTEGMFRIEAADGNYNLICEYVGFAKQTFSVNVSGNVNQNFELVEFLFAKAIDIFADRAIERKTPVAFTNVSKLEIENQLGSQDIPMVLNVTPSVFATGQGGGAGDARINVRGFSQRNMAVMINGVPVNDMESGWVYWSNWDGLGDATSSIQVQRGLSAVNLATPSIGGTMNILTDPTAHEAGVTYKNETGIGNFQKQTLFVNSGLVDDRFAVTLGGVRKTADGQVDNVWTDSWAYYFGASYQLDAKNRLEVYATGAPQRHGQRRWKLNAANFSHELAKDLGYSDEVLNDPKFADQGLLYNANWSGVSSSYQGDQSWDGDRAQRHTEGYINESENYYHKPIVNLNWYSQFSEDLSLYTTAYYSGGVGGGTGNFGSMGWNYGLKQRVIDYDATIARNVANLDTMASGREVSSSRGILRNSVNRQWTYGLLSKAYYKSSENLKFSFGLDWRTAEVDHYREVRDLLGGDVFRFTGNNFDSGDQVYKNLGDRIDYNSTNQINWLGGYAQTEYTQDQMTVYGTAGYSVIKYFLTDHFFNDGGSPKEIESDYIGGYQAKGGISYRLDQDLMIYANAGYVAKVPIFDQVIDDITTTLIEDFENEKFLSGELGLNWKGLDNTLSVNGNLYYTKWDNRATRRSVLNADGSEGFIFISGISQTHLGVEVDFAYQPVRYFRLDGAGSFASWNYNDDVSGSYVSDIAAGTKEPFNFYIKDLKVGDAPQTQFALAASVFPIKGLQAQLVYRMYDNYYADFNPFDRDDATDRAQVWKVPSYSLVDLHFSFQIPTDFADVKVFAHVFNLLNELYVQDATDNSSYNGYSDNGKNHSADDAEIYPGTPTSFNLGFQINL